MYKILIDTCVWLEMVKDHRQRTMLAVIENLVDPGIMELIVPRVIVDEFKRNKTKVSRETRQSSSSAIKRAKEVAEIYADEDKKSLVLQQLNELDHRLPLLSDSADDTIRRIERLLVQSSIIELDQDVMMRAARRAIDRRAPFHSGKNQMNDAILIETYADCVKDRNVPGTRFAFVTRNTKDFSVVGGNQKLPHPDIAQFFSRVRSRYFIRLSEAIHRIDPTLVSDLMMEYEWTTEPRSLTDILAAEHELHDMVWYNRHQNWKYKIETGQIKIVERETFPVVDHTKRPIQRDVWEGAKRAAAATEAEYGIENLGPWDDFEWGMINGKLSAIRWVLGDEWDFLDT